VVACVCVCIYISVGFGVEGLGSDWKTHVVAK